MAGKYGHRFNISWKCHKEQSSCILYVGGSPKWERFRQQSQIWRLRNCASVRDRIIFQVVFFQCCHGRGQHNPIPKMNNESPPKWKDLGVVFVHMFQVFFFLGGNIFNRRIFSAKWFNYQLIPCSLNRLACGIVSIDNPYWSTSIYIYICILYIHILHRFWKHPKLPMMNIHFTT